MATGATEFIDNTTADVFIPEIWSSLAIVAREAQLVFAKLVDRKFEDGLTKGDKLNIPNISDLAARAKSINAAITYETVTETNTTITVDQHYYAAIAVESITKVQSDRDMLAAYAGKLGYALGLNVDDALASQVEADWSGQTVGTLAAENTYHDYLRAIQYLDDANAPADSRYFVISPASEVGLLKMDTYINNDYTNIHGTGRESALDKAYISSFLGVPVYKSTNVDGTNSAGHDNTLFQKEAQALIMQMTPDMHTMFDIDYFADKVAIEQLYGEQVMRSDHGVWIKGA
jgi:hypothetical protein|tara:strand:+ start:2419 stop:3285 length:867 start_codon:yes stop_codon:yes gene_type:complete